MPKFKDLTGRIFGQWTVLERAADHVTPSGKKHVRWLCRCGCGFERSVLGHALASGSSEACYSCANRTHGQRETPEYRTWCRIKIRTTNPSYECYARYGGRGITVCERWLNSFEAFYADMGPRPSPKHSIERQNNDGDYTPENCCWATATEQHRNKSSNVNVTANGKTMCMAEWAKEMGIDANTIHMRIKRGWPEDLAVTLPKWSRLKNVGG